MDKAIPSPCKKVCEVDFQNSYCKTCGRYNEEIAKWKTLTTKEQLSLLQLAVLRLNHKTIKEG